MSLTVITFAGESLGISVSGRAGLPLLHQAPEVLSSHFDLVEMTSRVKATPVLPLSLPNQPL